MKNIDMMAVEKFGIKIDQMMELAGFNLAILSKKILKGSLDNKIILLLIGKGNNGGGGLVAARHLINWGAVVIPVLAQKINLRDGVRDRLKTLELMTKVYCFERKVLEQFIPDTTLIVDALIGYSIKGNPRIPISEMIEIANNSCKPILSLDLPSGLDPTTGKTYEPCIRANYTLTLALPKTGLINRKSRQFVGDLYLADIGLPRALYKILDIKFDNIFKTSTLFKIN